MRYAMARYQSQQRDLAYRIYVCESLRMIPRGEHLVAHFADIIDPKPPEPEQTYDEIVAGVLAKLNEKG